MRWKLKPKYPLESCAFDLGLKDFLVTSESSRVSNPKYLEKNLKEAAIASVIIERRKNKCEVSIYTAKPGVIIGRGGEDIEKLRKKLSKLVGEEIFVNIVEEKNPDLNASLVAQNIASQIAARAPFRSAQKRAIRNVMKAGAKGGCAAFTDSTARLISIGLRYGVPIEVIIDQLCSVKCDNYRFQVGKDGTLKGKSCSDAVGRLLKDMLPEQNKEMQAIQEVLRPGVDLNDLVRQAAINVGIDLGEELKCPECGFPLQRVEGCLSCDCGYSKC
jgi:hypothetical protein